MSILTPEEVIQMYASQPGARTRAFYQKGENWRTYITELNGNFYTWTQLFDGFDEDAGFKEHPNYEAAIEELRLDFIRAYEDWWEVSPYKVEIQRDENDRVIGFVLGEHQETYLSEEVSFQNKL